MLDNAPQSAPLPAAPVLPTPSVAPVPPRRSRTGLIIGIIALLLLVGVGSAGAYYFLVYLQKPELVLGRSMLAMGEVEQMTFDATLELSGNVREGSYAILGSTDSTTGEETAPLVASMHVKGVGDFPDTISAVQTSVDMDFRATIGDDAVLGPIAVSAMYVDEVQYLSLTELKLPILDTMLAGMTGGMEVTDVTGLMLDRWISVDMNAITERMGVKDKLDAAEEERQAKYDALKPEIEAAFAEFTAEFFAVTQNYGKTELNGVTTQHYAYTVNKVALQGFAQRIQTVLAEDVESGTERDMQKMVDVLDSLSDLRGEMWIGADDFYMYKCTLTGTAQPPEGEDTMQFSFTVEMNDFNEPVTLTAPEDADSIEDVMSEVMAAVMAEREAALRDDDADGLTVQEEVQYGTDPAKIDSDGDGYSDGDEVKGGYNPAGEGAL